MALPIHLFTSWDRHFLFTSWDTCCRMYHLATMHSIMDRWTDRQTDITTMKTNVPHQHNQHIYFTLWLTQGCCDKDATLEVGRLHLPVFGNVVPRKVRLWNADTNLSQWRLVSSQKQWSSNMSQTYNLIIVTILCNHYYHHHQNHHHHY